MTRRRHAAARLRGDGGFTLPELVISTMIMGIVLVAVAAALIVGLRGGQRPEDTFGPSSDANLLSRYFSADVQSASVTDIAANAPSGCAYATPAGARNVLALSWIDNAPDVPVHHAVAYQHQPATATLTRIACEGAATPEVRVLADDVRSADARIDTASGGISLDVSAGAADAALPGSTTTGPSGETGSELFRFTLRAYGRLAGSDASGLGPGAALLPAGEVAGSVIRYDDLAGTTNPEPVAGVTLQLRNDETDVVATTGTNGKFYFGTLDDGRYQLTLQTPSYLPTVPQQTLTVPVSVDAGKDGTGTGGGSNGTDGTGGGGGADGGTGAELAQNLSVVQVGALSGQVRTDRYVMLAGIKVELTGPVQLETTTNDNGQYRFGELPTGTYTVEVATPDGYAPLSGAGCTVEVAGDEPTCADAVFRIRMAAITGIVRSDTDQAIAGATVTLSGATTRTTTTDTAGRYRFGDLGDGTYTVTVSPPVGYASVQGATCTRTLAGVDVTCPDAIVQRTASSVTGIVLRDVDLDGDGDVPLAGAYVKLWQNGQRLQYLYTGPDGLFRFDNVAPGSYTVWHYTPGSQVPGLINVVPTSGQVNITVLPGKPIEPITFVDRKPCSVVSASPTTTNAVRLDPASTLPVPGQVLTVATDGRCWGIAHFVFAGGAPGPADVLWIDVFELGSATGGTTITTLNSAGVPTFFYQGAVPADAPKWTTGSAVMNMTEYDRSTGVNRNAGKTLVKVFA